MPITHCLVFLRLSGPSDRPASVSPAPVRFLPGQVSTVADRVWQAGIQPVFSPVDPLPVEAGKDPWRSVAKTCGLILGFGKREGFEHPKGVAWFLGGALAGHFVEIDTAAAAQPLARVATQGLEGQGHDNLLGYFIAKVDAVPAVSNHIHVRYREFEVIRSIRVDPRQECPAQRWRKNQFQF